MQTEDLKESAGSAPLADEKAKDDLDWALAFDSDDQLIEKVSALLKQPDLPFPECVRRAHKVFDRLRRRAKGYK